MFKPIFLSILLASSAASLAQDLDDNLLSFNESASVSVLNDTMNVILRVQVDGKSRTEVANTVSRRVNAILSRAKVLSALTVTTGERSAYPQYSDKRAITGWTDIADIRVESMDFDALSKFVADSQNDAAVENISFSVSPKRYEKAVEEASTAALKSFRQRAELVSKTLGFSGSYKIVKIQLNQSFENESESGFAAPMAMYAAESKVMARSANVMQTQAGSHRIRQTVSATVQMQ